MFDGEEIARLLWKNGFRHIHHANTASTALTYIKNGAILSRQFIDSHRDKYWQTMQGTDEKDKEYNIFNDIFFDIENIWELSRINFYGPVVFQFPISVLSGKKVRITTCNPKNWDTLPPEQWYISDVNEIIESCTQKGNWNFKNHIIVPNTKCFELNELERILFYCTSDDYNGDPRNNPLQSYNILEKECNKKGISIIKLEKESILINSYGLFYGFMNK